MDRPKWSYNYRVAPATVYVAHYQPLEPNPQTRDSELMLLSRLHEHHVDSLRHDQESHLNPWFKDHACYGTGGGATL